MRFRVPYLSPTVAALALGAGSPVLYPIWLEFDAARRPEPKPPRAGDWPPLTVIVPAYKEEAVIASKLEDVRSNGYSGELELIVIADDQATAVAAREAGATVIEPEERRGKATAVNIGVAAATGAIVVLSDADTSLRPGSLAALARWFVDPQVSAVAAEKTVAGSDQGLYWAVESRIKRAESRRRTTIGVVGELVAIRRSAFRPLPPDTALDDLWMGLDMIEAGGIVRYEPEARSVEVETPSLASEWERRTRTQAGLIDLLWRRRRLLAPGSPVATELWGHKLLRTVVGPASHALLLVVAVGSLRRSRVARAFACLHALGALAVWRRWHGLPLPRPARLAAQILFLQATALGAVARFARRESLAAWPKEVRPETSRAAFGAPSGPSAAAGRDD